MNVALAFSTMQHPRRITATGEATMRDDQERRRDALREWISINAARLGMSPAGIAKQINVARSTISNFMRPDWPYELKTSTIANLEELFGRPAPSFSPATDRRQGFADSEAQAYNVATTKDGARIGDLEVLISAGVNHPIDPWILKSRALECAGYVPNDVLFVDPTIEPRDNDVVCVQVYSRERPTAETVFRIYAKPYVVSATLDAGLRRPLLVDGQNVAIRGVVIGSVRPRAA